MADTKLEGLACLAVLYLCCITVVKACHDAVQIDIYSNNEDGIVLLSPNYPDYYMNHVELCWELRVDAGTVRLDVLYFFTEHNYDFLYLHAGDTEWSPYFAALHGYIDPSMLPQSYNSNSTTMFLRFLSDGSVTRTGFQLCACASNTPLCACETMSATETPDSVYDPGNAPDPFDPIHPGVMPPPYDPDHPPWKPYYHGNRITARDILFIVLGLLMGLTLIGGFALFKKYKSGHRPQDVHPAGTEGTTQPPYPTSTSPVPPYPTTMPHPTGPPQADHHQGVISPMPTGLFTAGVLPPIGGTSPPPPGFHTQFIQGPVPVTHTSPSSGNLYGIPDPPVYHPPLSTNYQA